MPASLERGTSVTSTSDRYYRADLARAHHLGFGFHADACAPGILALLAPVLERGGLVVGVGCRAWARHRGFGFHADACAPGILALLAPVLERGGLVVELGCGSGLLTRHLVDAGHRVIATDASLAMLDLAREHVPGIEDMR